MTLSEIRAINLETKTLRGSGAGIARFRQILKDTAVPNISAITVCFTDIEGRLHLLDYDKDFLLDSYDNLTFDGSSIRGFTDQHESDLRLEIDWEAAYLIPWENPRYHAMSGMMHAHIDKITVFGTILDRDGKPYHSDFRAQLKQKLAETGTKFNVAAEIEGFLFKMKDAEQKYNYGFDVVNHGGYFNTMPGDSLRTFIDTSAAIQRAVGFENEKDHPEVAPSQFETNWKYCEALIAADQIQLYKIINRRVARSMGYTACFLPKPMVDVNGSGMHINISMSEGGKNLFHNDKFLCDGLETHGLSELACKFIDGILYYAKPLCLICNSSVNSYRRLDPKMEAPNEIKVSAVDRGSMIRIPLANEKSARIEVRTVSPDANPYLVLLALIEAGTSQSSLVYKDTNKKSRGTLPPDIYQAIAYFRDSDFISELMGPAAAKFADRKELSADRCPRALGTTIKVPEIIYHHEVTNQQLWNRF